MQVFYEFNVLACTHFMFFSSWAVELAPTNTLVTPFCCNIQASAISASVSSLSPASAFHFLSCSSSSGVRAECFRKCSFCHTAVCRYSVEISVGEKSLCQKLFTLHLSFVNAYKQGLWRGEEFLFTLHPLFTTLHRYVVRSLPALPFLHRKGNKNIQYNRCIE